MRDDEEQVFAEALGKKAPDERAAFLDQACRSDPEFRGAIESLLAAHDDASHFLESPAIGLGDGADGWIREQSATASDGAAEFDPIPHALIGDYQLLEQIGEGGMGVVYLAEQQRLSRRKVAVKIIKPGMDSRQVVGRFETERHALSMMDHPNIARVLDAGTTPTGRPFFVMEWVSGLPITRYCEENGCTTAERLRLFLQVCHAVEHAHQKGVIHRDLKPSNVMVTLVDGNPVPKVIDFGVAKATDGALADAARHGQTLTVGPAQVLGTPMYMSPEQAALAPDVDTRSDVYSLGVLLYELLCGLPPFDRRRLADAPLDEVRRIIREERPPRPSLRIRAAVAGAPPAQSRATATPPAAPQRPAATPSTTLQSPTSPHPTLPPTGHPRPTPARPDPLRLARVLRGDLDCITGKAMAKDRALRYSTADALACDVQRYLDGEPILARPPGAAYRVGKFVARNKLAVSAAAAVLTLLVLGVVGTSTAAVWALRARDLARQHQRRAEDAARDSAATADFIEQVLASANPWDSAWHPARADATVEPLSLRQVLDQTSRRVNNGALKDQPAVEARVRTALAAGYSAQGIYFEAQQHLQAVLNLHRSAPVVDEPQLAKDMLSLAEVLAIQGRDPQAVRLAADAVAIRRRVRGTPPALIADALDTESRALRVFGDVNAAKARAEDALDLRKRIPPYPAAEADHARSKYNLAMALARQGDDKQALPMLRAVLGADRRLLQPGHPQVATDLYNLALLYRRNNQLPEAIACLQETVELRRKYLAEEEQEVSTAVLRLSQFLRAYCKFEDAQALLQERERRVPPAKMPARRRLELLREWVALYQDWDGHDAQLTAAGRRLQDELRSNLAELPARPAPSPAASQRSAGSQSSATSQPSADLWLQYFNRGRVYARLGQFQSALTDLDAAVGINPDAFEPQATRAAIHAYLGDRAYAAECAALVKRYASSDDHLQFGLVVHIAAMLPGAVDPALLCDLSDRLVKLRETDQRLMPRARLLRGVAAYRAGRFDEACTLLHDTRLMEFTSERLTAELFTAMAHHQAGRFTEANEAFLAARDKVRRLLPRPTLGDPEEGDLSTWILCNLAHREATKLITGEPPPENRAE